MDAAAVDSHVNNLAADLRYAAAIPVVEEKDPPRAVFVLTPIALGTIGLLPIFPSLSGP